MDTSDGPSTPRILPGDAPRALRQASVGTIRVLDLLYPAGLTLPRHDHEHGYLCLVVSGGFEESWRGGERYGTAGSFFYYPSQLVHHGRFWGAHGARVLHVEIRNDDARALCPAGSTAGVGRGDLRDNTAAGLSWQLLRELQAGAGATELVIEGLLADLMAEVFGAPPPRRSSVPPWLDTVDQLLRAATTPPRLASIASEVDRHPSHVAREYRRHTGLTIGQRARRLQVARVAAALAGSSDPLSHIAHDAGFADQSHMGRAFKALMDASPAAYRRALTDNAASRR